MKIKTKLSLLFWAGSGASNLSLQISTIETGNHAELAEIFQAIGKWLVRNNQPVQIDLKIDWKSSDKKVKQ